MPYACRVTHRRPPRARTWVMRWLLVAVALAGWGVVQVGHCDGGPPPPAVIAEITADGITEAGPDTATDDCPERLARRTAATNTGFALHPPASVTTMPAVSTTAAGRPRMHSTVTLIRIGVSRT